VITTVNHRFTLNAPITLLGRALLYEASESWIGTASCSDFYDFWVFVPLLLDVIRADGVSLRL
jgi:hypothetical protein